MTVMAGRPTASLDRRPVSIVVATVAALAIALALAVPAQAHAPYTALSWGQNGRGTLGDGECCSSDVPVAVSNLSGVTALASERGTTFYGQALALLENGAVWGWGRNEDAGQVGDGTKEDKNTPVPVCAVGEVKAPCTNHLSGAKAIAAGNVHSLALLENGTVAEWGEPGDGTVSMTPVAKSGLGSVKAIAASGDVGNKGTGDFSLALLENGTVMAWGANGAGRLGNGSEISSIEPVPVCVVGEKAPCVNHLSGVKSIAADVDGGLALLENGTVVAWGANGSGQLGNGTQTSSSVPVPVCAVGATSPCAEESQQLKGVSAIAAGQRTSVALLENGTVVSWGAPRLGNGTTSNSTTPVPVCAAGETAPCTNDLSGATAIASGGESPTASYALIGGGGVMAWGDGSWHELGNGSTQSTLVPVAVCGGGEKEEAPCAHNLANATAIAAGDEQGFAIGPYPLVTSVGPKEGYSGTKVTIKGVNFTGATGVRFGSTAAKSFTVTSDSSITAVVPSGGGTVDVFVTTPQGTSGVNSADRFTHPAIPGENLPELGRCVKLANKSGAYTHGNCIAVSKTHTGEFEWLPGPGANKELKERLSSPVFETANGSIGCAYLFASGEFTGAKSLKITEVQIQGCLLIGPNLACYTNPLEPNKIVSKTPLVGELGDIPGSTNPANPYLGWDLHAENRGVSPTIVEFSCGESGGPPPPPPPTFKVSLEGSVIGRVIKTNLMQTLFSMNYKQAHGIQSPSAFIGGPEDVLTQVTTPTANPQNLKKEQAGLKTGGELVPGEALELKAQL